MMSLRNLNLMVDIEHIPGRRDVSADRLSRQHKDISVTVAHIGVSTASILEPLDIDEVEKIQRADPLIKGVICKLQVNDIVSMTSAEKGLSYDCYVTDGISKRGCDRGPTGEFYSQFVLPISHPRCRKLVENAHHRLQHGGRLLVHNQLRWLVWFPKMRRLVSM